MKRLTFFAFIALFIAACGNPNTSNVETKVTPIGLQLPQGQPFSLERAAEANNKAGYELFMAKRSGGKNLFLSPYSISSALAMTYAGAAGTTESQLAQSFHWPKNSLGLHTGLAQQTNTLDAEKNKLFNINVANRIYVKEGLKLYKEFAEINQKKYGASVQSLDFEKTAEAASEINDWVSKKTEKMIPKLLEPDLLDGAQLVLVNAIFFYGGWANPFMEESTSPDTFFVQADQPVMTDMMFRHWSEGNDDMAEDFNYYEDSLFQVLEMPYHENKGTMIIFLPQQNDSMTYALDSLMDAMTYPALLARINALSRVDTDLYLKLPKWKQRSQALLKDTYKKMGLQAPFSDNAEFPRMTDEVELKISEIVHEAIIEVSEKGTKAAASTAVITKETSAAPSETPPIYFTANRPFFYLIKDQKTGTILFMGQFCKPE